MSKFVKTIEGAIHSVLDTFHIPDGWSEITEDEAKTAHPALVGEPDPQVEAVKSHTNTGPVPDVPSTGAVGVPDKRVIEPTPSPRTAETITPAAPVAAEEESK